LFGTHQNICRKGKTLDKPSLVCGGPEDGGRGGHGEGEGVLPAGKFAQLSFSWR